MHARNLRKIRTEANQIGSTRQENVFRPFDLSAHQTLCLSSVPDGYGTFPLTSDASPSPPRLTPVVTPTGGLHLSGSILSRLALVVLTTWGLSMVLPSFYRLAWPLASFGLTVDNNGIVIDAASPFEHSREEAPAAEAGLAIG